MTDQDVIACVVRHGGILGAMGQNRLKLCWIGSVGVKECTEELSVNGVRVTEHGKCSLSVLRDHRRSTVEQS